MRQAGPVTARPTDCNCITFVRETPSGQPGCGRSRTVFLDTPGRQSYDT